MTVDGLILTAYPNNFTHRSCWSSFQEASSSRFNRAITNSSLFVTIEDFCSIVSGAAGEGSAADYLLKLQECLERRLRNGLITISSADQVAQSYREVSDLMVDCLLLRYLSLVNNDRR